MAVDLHNVLHPRRIIDARQLHKNLILPETVFLNGGLSNTQLIDAVADGFDGLRYGAVLQISQRLRLHGDDPGIFGAGIGIVFRKPIGNDGAKIGSRFGRTPLMTIRSGLFVGSGLRNFGVVDFPSPSFPPSGDPPRCHRPP